MCLQNNAIQRASGNLDALFDYGLFNCETCVSRSERTDLRELE